MPKTLTENDIENDLSTKDLVKLDDAIQDIKQGVEDTLSKDLSPKDCTKEVNSGLNELKVNTDKFHLPKLYKNVSSLAKGIYIDDLYSVEDNFFVKVGKRSDSPDGWDC